MLLLGITKIFRGWKCQTPMPRYPGTSEMLSPKWQSLPALTTPSLTFSFIPCLEGHTMGGNKNLLSCCIQAAASSLFALFFAGKSLNSPPKAGLFPRATPWTGIQSCGQRAVSSQAGSPWAVSNTSLS